MVFLSFKDTDNDKLKEDRTKSSQCDPYDLGYTRATMKITKSNKKNKFFVNL